MIYEAQVREYFRELLAEADDDLDEEADDADGEGGEDDAAEQDVGPSVAANESDYSKF